MRIPGIAAHPSHKLAGKVENSFKRVHLSLWSALCARHLFPYPPAIAIYPKPRSDWVLSVETTFEADRSWTSIHLLRHPDLSTDVLYLLAHLFCQVQCSCSPYPHIERNDLVPVFLPISVSDPCFLLHICVSYASLSTNVFYSTDQPCHVIKPLVNINPLL
ncbi:hypothetical protein Pst134EB_001242 [Puccinia striiformis f. sp. tritici]|nr:hypothetical protein Pst134EB_001242 [Puccinia striiformis f. sp. tritici]